MFNKSLVAAYTSALRPDILKIQKNIYITTTCFWHDPMCLRHKKEMWKTPKRYTAALGK
jgi:hypothetical protein